MRVHVLQHAAFEDAGMIQSWLDQRQCEVRVTRWFDGQTPAVDPRDLDLIVVMGGPMSVNDDADYLWLKSETAFIRQAIDHGVAVLGVCLGAQLIAAALGGRVYANPVREVGWFPVRAIGPATDDAFSFPDECMAFHWHGETFDLPRGAIHLAESAGCRVQAFQFGRNVIGLQFHLEITTSGVGLLAEHCTVDLAPGPYVQDERALLNAASERYAAAHALMERVLEYLARSVRAAA